MSKKKRRRVPSKSESRRGHVTAPSRSLADRHALRRVKAADSPLYRRRRKNELRVDYRPVEDLRHERSPYSDRREVFRTAGAREARVERRPEREVYGPDLSVPMHDYVRDPERALVCIQ